MLLAGRWGHGFAIDPTEQLIYVCCFLARPSDLWLIAVLFGLEQSWLQQQLWCSISFAWQAADGVVCCLYILQDTTAICGRSTSALVCSLGTLESQALEHRLTSVFLPGFVHALHTLITHRVLFAVSGWRAQHHRSRRATAALRAPEVLRTTQVSDCSTPFAIRIWHFE